MCVPRPVEQETIAGEYCDHRAKADEDGVIAERQVPAEPAGSFSPCRASWLFESLSCRSESTVARARRPAEVERQIMRFTNNPRQYHEEADASY